MSNKNKNKDVGKCGRGTLLVVGDVEKCGGCKGVREFVEKNKDVLKKNGITKVLFVNPDKGGKNAALADKMRKKYLDGIRVEPLNVVIGCEGDDAFLGFKEKNFLSSLKKSAKEAGIKKRGIF